MPWKDTSVLDERMKFIGRLLSGEKMAPLCREFGISRTTGHKIWKRYQESGSAASSTVTSLLSSYTIIWHQFSDCLQLCFSFVFLCSP